MSRRRRVSPSTGNAARHPPRSAGITHTAGPVRDDPGTPGAAALIDLKAVPGSSRDQIAGLLGNRLKVRVCAPPEDGKANAAICAMLAGALGIPARSIAIVAGHAHATKTARVSGIAKDAVLARLGLMS